MFGKPSKRDYESDIAALDAQLVRNAERISTQIDATRDRLIAAIREASAPAPGVRVFMRAPYGDPIEYPTAVGWECHSDGTLVVRLATDHAAATFAPDTWVGAERITPEPTEES